jgi:Uma2 family endonuclease
MLVHDPAGWRRERIPTLPDKAYFERAPDWVCEVLSPSTAQIDRVDKLSIYAAHGVVHAWLMDPDAQTLEILALHEDHWRLERAYKAAEEVCAPPFEAISFNLASFWP